MDQEEVIIDSYGPWVSFAIESDWISKQTKPYAFDSHNQLQKLVNTLP